MAPLHHTKPSMASPENPIVSSFSVTTPEEEDEASLYAHQLVSASVLPMTLNAVIELRVLEIITTADRFLSPTEIASQLQTSNPDAPVMLDRILRLLASYKILTYSLGTDPVDGSVWRSYGPAPVCKYLTANRDGVTMSTLSQLNHDKVGMESWYYLKDAVMEGGIPFNKAYGMSLFEYLRKDMRFNKVFNAAISNYSAITANKVLSAYTGFNGLRTLVDVGGGEGATLNLIIGKYPHLKGINFDLPHVIANAPSCPGVEHVGGDMFESVPTGDAIFMKGILHNWSDDHCLKLLKNCCKSLPDDGKVIVAEMLLPIAPEQNLAVQTFFHMDMIMLAYFAGGKERTEAELKSLSKMAGFSEAMVACCVGNISVMEFIK